mmetsp:Transcript_22528/g.85347  ORF Transcript_22528/g.85347 Transcript_22528/m.85347 type:complete len:205 (-) Transcript_22528:2119-2733(-)
MQGRGWPHPKAVAPRQLHDLAQRSAGGLLLWLHTACRASLRQVRRFQSPKQASHLQCHPMWTSARARSTSRLLRAGRAQCQPKTRGTLPADRRYHQAAWRVAARRPATPPGSHAVVTKHGRPGPPGPAEGEGREAGQLEQATRGSCRRRSSPHCHQGRLGHCRTLWRGTFRLRQLPIQPVHCQQRRLPSSCHSRWCPPLASSAS